MATLSLDVKRDLVSRLPLFARLAPADHEEIARVAKSMQLASKQELVHKGDTAQEVYAVVHGRLKVLTTSASGSNIVFSIMGPGEMIGEIALLGRTERTATVVAVDACQLLSLNRADFLDFLTRRPHAAITLLETLAQRITNISQLVEDTQFLSLPVRFAKQLVEQARRYGRETSDGLRIELRLSQEEWGDTIGATRESVNKQMRAWTDAGLLSVQERHVVIHQLDELKRLAAAITV